MNREAPITVVIVTYNSSDTVSAPLVALADSHAEGLVRAIIVDNASTDDTAATVTLRFPWVEIVANRENLGFGRACNVGLSMARSDYVLFLNPDAVLPLPALTKLRAHLEDHASTAIVAPAIVEPGGSVQKIHPLPTPWRVIAAAGGWGSPRSRAVEPGDPPRQSDWLCGAVLLARRKLLVEMGGFDPRFFLYFEETDLCRRIAAAGHELWTVGQAVATHISGASAATTNEEMRRSEISKHYYESRYYYLRKHFGTVAAGSAELGELAILGLRAALKRAIGRTDRRFRERLRAPLLRSPTQPPSRPL
tara:strand:+ start:9051 stop:9971 length:921 start_codon:yes stop_codon:yes gene_type:complete